MNNSPKQVPSTPDESGNAMPTQKSSAMKNIAAIALAGAALVQAGCTPPEKDPGLNRPITNAKNMEPKSSNANMKSMADDSSGLQLISTKDIVGDGK